MADIIKESLNVNIHCIMQSVGLHLTVYLRYCMALISIRTEAIAMFVEFCFTNGFQYL